MKDNIVNVYVKAGTLINFTKNICEADFVLDFEKKETVKITTVNTCIIDYLSENGISDKSGGWLYLIMAIKIVSDKLKNNQRYTLSNDIYPVIAECYNVTENSVESAIRNTIDRSSAKSIGAKRFIQRYKLGYAENNSN